MPAARSRCAGSRRASSWSWTRSTRAPIALARASERTSESPSARTRPGRHVYPLWLVPVGLLVAAPPAPVEETTSRCEGVGPVPKPPSTPPTSIAGFCRSGRRGQRQGRDADACRHLGRNGADRIGPHHRNDRQATDQDRSHLCKSAFHHEVTCHACHVGTANGSFSFQTEPDVMGSVDPAAHAFARRQFKM